MTDIVDRLQSLPKRRDVWEAIFPEVALMCAEAADAIVQVRKERQKCTDAYLAARQECWDLRAEMAVSEEQNSQLREQNTALDAACARIELDNARMRDLLDRRPAMNAGLVEAYVQWTALVYASDIAYAASPDGRPPKLVEH